MTYTSTQENADRAEACANAECIHAQNGRLAAEVAQEYRYGIEEALDYLDDREITPEAVASLRGILQRAIETPAPTV